MNCPLCRAQVGPEEISDEISTDHWCDNGHIVQKVGQDWQVLILDQDGEELYAYDVKTGNVIDWETGRARIC